MLSLKTPQFSSSLAPAATRGALSNSLSINTYTKHLKIIDGISLQSLKTSSQSKKGISLHRFKKKSESPMIKHFSNLPILKFKVTHAS